MPDDPISQYNRKTLDELKADEISAASQDAVSADRRNHLMIERLLNEMTGAGNVAHDTS